MVFTYSSEMSPDASHNAFAIASVACGSSRFKDDSVWAVSL